MQEKEKFSARVINLGEKDVERVWELVAEKGLGTKGFSAAVRIIIREWAKYIRREEDD